MNTLNFSDSLTTLPFTQAASILSTTPTTTITAATTLMRVTTASLLDNITMEMVKYSSAIVDFNTSTSSALHHNVNNDIGTTGVGTLGVTILNNLTSTHNDTYLYTCPSIQMPVGNLISMILYAIVCIVGLFGNTLVIYVVLRFSKMQTVTNMYILNLALADECFLIGIPFLITTMYLGQWTFGKTMCKAYMVSTSITQFTSSIFLFIMSADRYIAVCHPISSPRYRTPFVSRIVSVMAWTTSALIMLPVMLYANTIEKDKNKISCVIEWPKEHEAGSGTTFTLYSLILGFATPLSLILAFYYLVIRKLQTVGPKTKSKEKRRSHRKVTKLVLTVITVYVLCWLPYWISQVALIHSPPTICNSRLEITVFLLVGCLGYSNSAMNPILYAFLSDNFKKSFLKACTCATGKDINAQLQMENSFFPKFGKNRGSDRLCSTSRTANNINSQIKNNNIPVTDSPTVMQTAAVFMPQTTTTIAPINSKLTTMTTSTTLTLPDGGLPSINIVNSTNQQSSGVAGITSQNNLSVTRQPVLRPPVLHTDL